MISTLLLTGTLVVLIVYTVFTHGLKKATVKQTELSQRPCVILFKKSTGGIWLENIGHSPALNIEIDSFESKEFRILFSGISLIRPGNTTKLPFSFEGKTTKAKTILEDSSVNVFRFPFFVEIDDLGLDDINDYFLTIHYNNIEKVSYQTVMKVLREEKIIEFIETIRIK